MSRRTRRAFRFLAVAVALSVLGGGLLGMVVTLIRTGAVRPQGFARGAVVAAIAAGVVFSFDLFALERPLLRRLRRQPFLVYVVAIGLVHLVVFLSALALGLWLVPVPGYRLEWTTTLLFMSFGVVFGLAFNAALLITRLLGRGVLRSFVTGRYYRPRREERIFLLLDLVGSTAIAERIGDLAFQQLLNDVFFDMTPALVEHGGEIYKYVGDEVIVTWPMTTPAADSASVSAALAARRDLERRHVDYQARYGVSPVVRAALHCGTVVAGEIGDVRREIGMWGDALNTVARIEEYAKLQGVSVIASGEWLGRISLPPGIAACSLGRVMLRGKEADVELFALTADGTGEARHQRMAGPAGLATGNTGAKRIVAEPERRPSPRS